VGQNPKITEPTDEKIGVSDYVSNDSPHAKTQNERPIGDVAAYAWNITIAWFLVFTAQRYAKRGICRRRVSVYPSDYLCVRHIPVLYQNG